MKLPRDLSGQELAKLLQQFGYQETRQTGSHVRLSYSHSSEHNLTVPKHSHLRIGTLSAILNDVATNLSITREELTIQIFGK